VNFALIQRHAVKAAAGLFLLSGILFVNPIDGMAASKNAEVQTRSSYMVTIAAPAVEVHASANEHSRSVGQVKRGQTYEVLSNLGNGWVKIGTESGDGYIKTSGKASLVEKNQETVDFSVRQRRQTVEFALQFIGGSYVFGGVDPNKGVDCSGFTRYILQNSASVSLPHSSKGQANCGTPVSEEEMQPGDLIFYGDDTGINHVAMYIGNGQVVHASTEATGIKTSPYNYRKPVKIVSVLS
jgi:peptidoglycan DL-endopeptidase CwlO